MRKIKLLLLSFLLLIFVTPLAAQADCEWTKKRDFGDKSGIAGNYVNTGGCQKSVESSDDKCTGTKPADVKVTDYETEKHVCCCYEDIVVNDPPKYIIPDFTWQVKIPGMSEKFSTVTCGDTCEIPWISEYVFGVYDYLLSIAGVLAVVMLMAAGLLWIVSGGDATRISQAKKMINGSILGLMLLVSLSLLLEYINPELNKKTAISLEIIKRKSLEDLAVGRRNNSANTYKNSGCASMEELKAGVSFYATGYYKPAYEPEDPDFWCIIAMQCTCPNGRDTTKNCDRLYGKTFPGYAPCKDFGPDTPYCNLTASGIPPEIGDIAGPDCNELPPYTKVCFKGKTYRITDKGGGIKGKRIDIWSGTDYAQALAHTGVGTLTIGECK